MADFTPTFGKYTGQGAFRFWCQTVLPLIYDDSLSYMELLNKMVIYLNNTIKDVATTEENVDALLNAYNQLQNYVNDYFDNLDAVAIIDAKLDEYVEDGTMTALITPFIEAGLTTLVTDWLDEYVTPVGSAVIVDSSLSISGAAADSKTVGDYALRRLTTTEINNLTSLTTMPKGVYFACPGSRLSELDSTFDNNPDFPINTSATYIVASYRYASDTYTTGGVLEVFTGGGTKYTGYKTNTGTSIRWYNESGRIGSMADSISDIENNLTNIETEIADNKALSMRRLTADEITNITSLAEMSKGTYFSCHGSVILEKEPNFPFDLTPGLTYIVRSYRYTASESSGIIEILTGGKTHYKGYIATNQNEITWYNVNADTDALTEKITALEDSGLRRLTTNEITEIDSITNMKKGSYFTMHGADIKAKCPELKYPLSDNASYIVVSYKYTAGTKGGVIEILSGAKTMYTGYIGTSGNEITWYNPNEVPDELKKYNTKNLLLDANTYNVYKEAQGLVYTGNPSEHTVEISGTATANSFCNIWGSTSTMVEGVKPGDTLRFKVTNLSNDVYIGLYLYPDTLPQRSIYIYDNKNVVLPKNCTNFLARINVRNGTVISGTLKVGIEVFNNDDAQTEGNAKENDGLKILVFGNSYSYSTLNYLGLVLKEWYPEKHFILGILYNSGASITEHLTKWNNNSAYTTYATYDSVRGTYKYWHDEYSGRDALYLEKWDYVILQNTVADCLPPNENRYVNLETLANNITEYLDYPIAFLYNIQQSLPSTVSADEYPAKYRVEADYPTGKDRSDGLLEDQFTYAQKVLNDCIVSDVIPCGTAVQNARSTSLANLGTMGDLSDDNRGHLQNGIGILIGAYTAAYKLCQICGFKPKLFANPFNPTDEELRAIGYTSSHGDCVGVTEANKIIAQKCALMAIKKPFEITDMSDHD